MVVIKLIQKPWALRKPKLASLLSQKDANENYCVPFRFSYLNHIQISPKHRVKIILTYIDGYLKRIMGASQVY
jgi:hypothetical protein